MSSVFLSIPISPARLQVTIFPIGKLHTGRYEVIGGRDAADIMREVIAKHMPTEEEQV